MATSGEDAKDQGNESNDRLIRLPEVLARVQISRSGWLKGVKEGRFPRGALLGPRVRVWKSRDIDAFIAALGREAQPQCDHAWAPQPRSRRT